MIDTVTEVYRSGPAVLICGVIMEMVIKAVLNTIKVEQLSGLQYEHLLVHTTKHLVLPFLGEFGFPCACLLSSFSANLTSDDANWKTSRSTIYRPRALMWFGLLRVFWCIAPCYRAAVKSPSLSFSIAGSGPLLWDVSQHTYFGTIW